MTYQKDTQVSVDLLIQARDALVGTESHHIGKALNRVIQQVPKTAKVTYNHGGSAVWEAVEDIPGWWNIPAWNYGTTTQNMSADYFWKNFTLVEDK